MRSALLMALAATASLAGVANAADSSRRALPFIDDDYGHALAMAKEQHRPLFVEAWAPW